MWVMPMCISAYLCLHTAAHSSICVCEQNRSSKNLFQHQLVWLHMISQRPTAWSRMPQCYKTHTHTKKRQKQTLRETQECCESSGSDTCWHWQDCSLHNLHQISEGHSQAGAVLFQRFMFALSQLFRHTKIGNGLPSERVHVPFLSSFLTEQCNAVAVDFKPFALRVMNGKTNCTDPSHHGSVRRN